MGHTIVTNNAEKSRFFTGLTRSRRSRMIAGLAALSVAALSSPVAQPANAASTTWWYDTYGVAAVHAEGWTGEGVKVAVIDKQINPDLPVFDGRDLTVAEGALCANGLSPVSHDPNFAAVHGTTITADLIGNGTGAGSIQGMAPDAEVTFYGLGTPGDEPCDATTEHDRYLSWYGWGLQRAIDDGNRIVVNATGLMTPAPADADVVANAIARGVVMIDATSNMAPGEPDHAAYPWGLNGVVAATAVDSAGALQLSHTSGQPLVHPGTTVVGAGVALPTVGTPDGGWDTSFSTSGSSFTAPLVGGMLAVVAQRYPDATGNQLIQTLIHNTGVDDHPLEHDAAGGYGYGAAWLTHMLRVDPLQYPDENPLLDKADAVPTAEQIAAAADRGSALPDFSYSVGEDYTDAGADDTSTSTTPDGDSPASGLLAAVTVVAALIVVGGAVLAVVLVARRRRQNARTDARR